MKGESGISRIPDWPTKDIQIGGQVDFDWEQEVQSVKGTIFATKRTALLLNAARQAMPSTHSFTPYDFVSAMQGLSLGFSGADLPRLYQEFEQVALDGSHDKLLAFVITSNTVSNILCREFNSFGHFTVSQENSVAGLNALGQAYHAVARGDAEVSLVAASEHCLHPRVVELYNRLGYLNYSDNGVPERASRPFDNNRRGAVLSDGGAALLVEELSHALARGAQPLAEVTAFTSCVDARHLTKMHEDGGGLRKTLEGSLDHIERLDALFASASGSLEGDFIEAKVIHEVLGTTTPVCALKGALGHSLAAAGLTSAAVGVSALLHQCIPPTLNFCVPALGQISKRPQQVIFETNVSDKVVTKELNHVLVQEAGWGGYSASVVLSKYEA
jgi:3-oxoacyl-[acyl-carrier-protein] synthase II